MSGNHRKQVASSSLPKRSLIKPISLSSPFIALTDCKKDSGMDYCISLSQSSLGSVERLGMPPWPFKSCLNQLWPEIWMLFEPNCIDQWLLPKARLSIFRDDSTQEPLKMLAMEPCYTINLFLSACELARVFLSALAWDVRWSPLTAHYVRCCNGKSIY